MGSADNLSVTTTESTLSPIVELRQYTLQPGKRDVLIDLFERELLDTQEAVGMQVIGQFRDADDPHRLVWLRGFSDMTTRHESLQAFYGGPVWKTHREAANATMIDSDNVLLLHPAQPGSGFSADLRSRPPRGATGSAPGLVIAAIYLLASDGRAMADYFEHTLAPALTNSDAAVLAWFITEASPNTFSALPIRENENVFVWFAGFGHATTGFELPQGDAPGLTGPPQLLRLIPTARSRLTGSSPPCPAMSRLRAHPG